jgi:hypothetical protein
MAVVIMPEMTEQVNSASDTFDLWAENVQFDLAQTPTNLSEVTCGFTQSLEPYVGTVT